MAEDGPPCRRHPAVPLGLLMRRQIISFIVRSGHCHIN
jgi:hypothetical protein